MFNVYQFAMMFYSAYIFYKSFSKTEPMNQVSDSNPYFAIRKDFFQSYSDDHGFGVGQLIWPLIISMIVCALIVWASVLRGINF